MGATDRLATCKAGATLVRVLVLTPALALALAACPRLTPHRHRPTTQLRELQTEELQEAGKHTVPVRAAILHPLRCRVQQVQGQLLVQSQAQSSSHYWAAEVMGSPRQMHLCSPLPARVAGAALVLPSAAVTTCLEACLHPSWGTAMGTGMGMAMAAAAALSAVGSREDMDTMVAAQASLVVQGHEQAQDCVVAVWDRCWAAAAA